jgi:hypothetical protein
MPALQSTAEVIARLRRQAEQKHSLGDRCVVSQSDLLGLINAYEVLEDAFRRLGTYHPQEPYQPGPA